MTKDLLKLSNNQTSSDEIDPIDLASKRIARSDKRVYMVLGGNDASNVKFAIAVLLKMVNKLPDTVKSPISKTSAAMLKRLPRKVAVIRQTISYEQVPIGNGTFEYKYVSRNEKFRSGAFKDFLGSAAGICNRVFVGVECDEDNLTDEKEEFLKYVCTAFAFKPETVKLAI